MDPAVPAVKRRPKDRKNQILEQAVRLFIDRGFHSVKLEDIAEAAGVTARALYRHYDNKQALLAAAIRTGQEQYQSARLVSQGEAPSTARAAERRVRRPDRRSRRVSVADGAVAARGPLPRRCRASRGAQAHQRDRRGHVRRRPAGDAGDLSPAHTELRAWAVASTLHQPGPAQPDPAGRRTAPSSCTGRAWRRHGPRRFAPWNRSTRHRTTKRALFSRHETLLATGARLFRAQGYPAVSTSEIGKGAGIAGPGLYRTFSSKQAILDALIRRLDEWWNLESIRALARRSRSRRNACAHSSTAGFGISLDDPDLVSVSITELSHASSEVRDGYTRNQADREGVWIDLIRNLVPADHRRPGATARRGCDQLHRRCRADLAPHALRRRRRMRSPPSRCPFVTSQSSPQRETVFRRRRAERFR